MGPAWTRATTVATPATSTAACIPSASCSGELTDPREGTPTAIPPAAWVLVHVNTNQCPRLKRHAVRIAGGDIRAKPALDTSSGGGASCRLGAICADIRSRTTENRVVVGTAIFPEDVVLTARDRCPTPWPRGKTRRQRGSGWHRRHPPGGAEFSPTEAHRDRRLGGNGPLPRWSSSVRMSTTLLGS